MGREEKTYPEKKRNLEIGEEGVELSKQVFICCRAEENVVGLGGRKQCNGSESNVTSLFN